MFLYIPIILLVLFEGSEGKKGELYLRPEQTYKLPSLINRSEVCEAATYIHSMNKLYWHLTVDLAGYSCTMVAVNSLVCRVELSCSFIAVIFYDCLEPHFFNIVTCLLKARTVEPEKTSVSRQWFCKHVSETTKSCDHSNTYTQQTSCWRWCSLLGPCTGYTRRAIWSFQPSVCIWLCNRIGQATNRSHNKIMRMNMFAV
jgi:hypothetical protein